MQDLMDLITQFAQGHSTLVLGLFGLSEVLAYLPFIKGNSVFQTIGHILAGLKDIVQTPTPPPPPAK